MKKLKEFRKIISKYSCLIMISVLVFSCKKTKHELSYNVKEQVFYSCNRSPLRNLRISNDSIKKDGFLFEGAWLLSWNGKEGNDILSELKLQNLPNNYTLTKGGLRVDSKICKLKPNCSYLVEKFGGGQPSFFIRIWTNSISNVYKTTHPKCGLKSLTPARSDLRSERINK